MKYLHRLRVTRASGGSTAGTLDPETGAWTPASGSAADAIYDGPADVQDDGAAVQRSQMGDANLKADAIAFLEDEGAAPLIRANDTAEVFYSASTTRFGTAVPARVRYAEVVKAVGLDGKLYLRFRDA